MANPRAAATLSEPTPYAALATSSNVNGFILVSLGLEGPTLTIKYPGFHITVPRTVGVNPPRPMSIIPIVVG